MHTITKEFAFEAAHHLPQMPDGHQCKRPHGHSYVVVVELQADTLDQYGFVKDYGELVGIKRDIDGQLDHRNLGDVFGAINTTAERLAENLYTRWRALYPQLTAVTVRETAKTSATYRE